MGVPFELGNRCMFSPCSSVGANILKEKWLIGFAFYFLHLWQGQQVTAHFQCNVVIHCLRQLRALVLNWKLLCFPPSESSFDNYHSLGRLTGLSVMICHRGCPVGRVSVAFKFGTPRLHVLQEFQSWNRTGACNCASGPVLTTEIDHHNAFLVPWQWQCHENPRSLSKSLHENSTRNKYT